MSRIANLPTLTPLHPNLFGMYEIAGRSYSDRRDAAKHTFLLDKHLVFERLVNWEKGTSFAIKNYMYMHLNWCGTMRKLIDVLYTLRSELLHEQDPRAAGLLVRHRIMPAVKSAEPTKKETQSFVNWYRLWWLLDIFMAQYDPISVEMAALLAGNDPDDPGVPAC